MTILTLDILNKPSEIIGNIDNTILIVSVVGTVFIAIICIAHHKVFSNLKLSNINYTDCIITYVFVTSFFGFIAWIILDGFLCYKTLGALFIFITSSILLVVRALTLHNINNKISTTNLFDLKDICEGKFKVAPNQPILLSEKDVDYDLLRRNGIITLLKKNITSYTANRSFVIGLVGEWGSGKTTIINNVKKDIKPKNKSIILIDDFDPWIFGSQEALLAAMYENILKHTEIKVSISQNNSIMRILSQTVSELSSTALNVSAINTIIGTLSNTNSTYENADILKELIGDFLISQRKTVVFIIDNLDRAESENIILLFKVMGTIFDIPNIIYFLSYDKKRIEDILNNTNKINPKYIEKIVQQEVHVPAPQEEILREIYYLSMGNILLKYGVGKDELKSYEPIFSFILENVKNLRKFKRIINSAFPTAFLCECNLDRFTLLSLEILCFLEPDLYSSIKDNRQFYISEDLLYDRRLYPYSFNKEKREADTKNYFNELFITYPNYKAILSSLFPNVKKSVKDIVPDPLFNNNINEARKNFPIYSVKFFDLYFSYGVNDFYNIRDTIKSIIKIIGSSNDEIEVKKAIEDKIIKIDSEYHKEYFETFSLFIDDIPSQKSMLVIEVLWNNIYSIDNGKEFLALDARQRVLVIIAELFDKINDKELSHFTAMIKNDYSHLFILDELIYWINSEKTRCKKDVYQKIYEVYSKNCENVINNRINLYDDSYYCYNNIWGLIRYYKDNKNKDKILQSYFEGIFSEKNIYRMIGDAINCSIGSVYGYGISNDSFNALYLEQSKIDKAIKNYPPTNESEKTVLEIYNKYLEKQLNIYDSYGITSTTAIKFEL